MLLLKHEPDDENVNWLEEHHQAHIVVFLRRMKKAGLLDFEVGMEGIHLLKPALAKAKIQGMDAGSPDFRIYLDGPRMVLIELKRWTGKTTPSQDECHLLRSSFGFEVYVIKSKTPAMALEQVQQILGFTKCQMKKAMLSVLKQPKQKMVK